MLKINSEEPAQSSQLPRVNDEDGILTTTHHLNQANLTVAFARVVRLVIKTSLCFRAPHRHAFTIENNSPLEYLFGTRLA